MRGFLTVLVLGLGLVSASSAAAAERIVTLEVEGLKGNCPSCALIVKRTLARVAGVHEVKVSLREGTATVRFDDELATVAEVAEAPGRFGFPARPLEPGANDE